MSDKNVIHKGNRIFYVEPNDIYAQHMPDGSYVQQTPPPEDFCISFNLVVQNFSRFRENRGLRGNFILSWTTSSAEYKNATFLGGDDFGQKTLNADAPNYLTTYYTDISFDNYGTKRIVEGLGVEQIQVAWESWYTPTVTMKFVDVRGSAIWSNEEAIHENGQITADNIFGCFFTFPYPQFTLQMKGFLGKPVSYQLTCSGFQGEYDSNTGNFIATATFIGYTYSVMTDIPMQYLIMAPDCNYVGKAYWDSKVNTAEWALPSGGTPPKFTELFKRIKGANVTSDMMAVNSDETAALTNIANKRSTINKIKSYLEEFLGALKTQGLSNTSYVSFIDQNVNVNNEITRQVILFYDGGDKEKQALSNTATVRFTKEAQDTYNKLVSTLTEYNSIYSDTKISPEKLPNGWQKCPTDIEAQRMFYITRDSQDNVSDITLIGNSGKSCNIQNIHNLRFNDKRQIALPIAEQIYTAINRNSVDQTVLREFCYIVDVNDFAVLLNQELDTIRKENENIQDRISKRIADDVVGLVGFRPYIGDVFKIIMCHLDTFMQIMFSAGQEIYDQSNSGLRNPSYLGITITDTDIPMGKCDYITPWPKIVNRGSADSNGNYDNSNNYIAWVGDFSHNFTEEKVVLEIEAAIRKINESYNNTEQAREGGAMPLTIDDFCDMGDPFGRVSENLSPSGLAGYLGFRAFQLLGVMCDSSTRNKFAELFGKMDAYNLYNSIGSADTIKTQLIQPLGNGVNGSTLIGVSACQRTYDDMGSQKEGSSEKQQDFETEKWVAYSQSKRHPIVATSGNNYVFAHFYDKSKNSLIPTELKTFTAYASEDFKYNAGSSYADAYYDIRYATNTDAPNKYTHLCNTKKLLSTAGVTDTDDYTNSNMFNIIRDEHRVNNIIEVYNNLNGGSIKIGKVTVSEDFSEYVNQFIRVNGQSFGRFMSETSLSQKRDKLGVNESKLLPISGSAKNVDFSISSKWLNNKNNVILQEDGQYKVSGDDDATSLDNLTIQQFEVYHNSFVGNEKLNGNLFGCPFYYMQNNIEDTDVRRYVKALLFLHTFKYDYGVTLNVFSNSKHSGSVEAVPYGYLLLLGALLWRKRYAEQNENTDPIVWSEGSNVYKAAQTDCSLFRYVESQYRLCTIKSGSSATYNISMAKLFGGMISWEPDKNIENQLINFFVNFADAQFVTMMNKFEIKSRANSGGAFNFTTLYNTIKKFNDAIKLGNSKGVDFLNGDNGIAGWEGVYRAMRTSSNGDILYMLLDEDISEVNAAKNLYTDKVIVLDGCYRRLNNQDNDSSGEINIPQNDYNKYLNSFITTLNTIVTNIQSEQVEDTSSPMGSDKLETTKDFRINIYNYCKNIWDKWLVPNSFTEDGMRKYTVKNFFDRFKFIDSYYCNVAGRLPINCETLLSCMGAADTETSLSMHMFTYIDHILSTHGCMFFSLPQYIGFLNEDEATEKYLSDMFKALPYNDYDKTIVEDNDFVIIYTNKPASICNGNDEYVADGFDIWSISKGTAAAPAIFDSHKLNEEESASRYGYSVPSFGVQVNRQNNHIFKNIKLSMANPVITDATTRAMENIYRKGGEGERRVVFHGQDLYQIYTSYAYQCEIEMMGCSQIWPLMYFQLLNIPMWRGTYMIFKVTHTMTPGNMSTVFTGIKQSSTPIAFAQSFFTVKNEEDSIDDYGDFDTTIGLGSGPYVEMPNSYPKVTEFSRDHYHDAYNHQSKKTPSMLNDPIEDIQNLYNCLYEEIMLLDENGGGSSVALPQWNIMITNVNKGGSWSDHTRGKAIDLTIMHFKNGDPTKTISVEPNSTDKKRLLTVLDMLYLNHRDQLKQVIFEYNKVESMNSGSWYSDINVLHVSAKALSEKYRYDTTARDGDDRTEFFIAAYNTPGSGGHYGCINKGHAGTWFLENVTPEFRKTASRGWFNDKANFKSTFINYGHYGFTDDQLTAHFSVESVNGVAQNLPKETNDRIKQVMPYLLNNFQYSAATAICANMLRESTLNPAAVGDSGKAQGLCQWHPDRQTTILANSGCNAVKNMSYTQQIDGMRREMKTWGMIYTDSESKPNYSHPYKGSLLSLFSRNPLPCDTNTLAKIFMIEYERPRDADFSSNTNKNNNFIATIKKVYPPTSSA